MPANFKIFSLKTIIKTHQKCFGEFQAAYDAEALQLRAALTEARADNGGSSSRLASLRARADAAAAESANLCDIILRQKSIRGFWIAPKASYTKKLAEVRELEAVKRAATRPVDPRAAIAFRVPEPCFVRIARFLYYAARPPPTPPPLDAGVLGLLEGFVRRPPAPG